MLDGCTEETRDMDAKGCVMQSPHKVDLVVDNFQQLTARGN